MHVTASGTSLPKRLCNLLKPRLVAWIMIGCLFMISERSTAQKVTLSLKKAPVEKVFEQIQEQTGYQFFYTREDVSDLKPVTINVKEEKLTNVLNQCFKNTGVTYQINDHYVTIKLINHKQPSEGKDTTGLLQVMGRITNERSEGLPAATLQIKGTQTLINTDNQGYFKLDQIAKGTVLIISSIGYQKDEIKVTGATISHVLKTAVTSLDETVVIAYGTTTRRLNTGAVGRLAASDIEKQPVSNPLGALEGRITGLQITQRNGLPGSSFNVLIRGTNSIQSGNDPLYIIDGVPFLNNTTSFAQRSGLVANSPFNNIDPSTIESIEVLKDADATAIYGSRGANGVVLITTKKSKESGTHVGFSYTQQFSKIRKAMPLMNTPNYLAMRREAFKNDGIIPDETNAPDLLVWDTTRYIDWKKLLIGSTALSENAQVQLSGGNASTKFGVGFGYLNDGTVFQENFFDKRFTGNVFLSHQSSDKKFNLNLTAS